MPFTKEDVLSLRDVQEILGISKNTVKMLLTTGKIRYFRAESRKRYRRVYRYLISRQAVEDFVNNKTEE